MSGKNTAGRAGEVASTPEAHGFEPPYSEDLEKLGQEMAVDDWTTHNSRKPPTDLASAQLVKARVYTLDRSAFSVQIRTVSSVPWGRCDRYRPALSDDGLPLCSAEGLEPSSYYVFTPSSGFPAQCPERPECRSDGMWFAAGWSYAPSAHRKPGPWHESLMEVRRG